MRVMVHGGAGDAPDDPAARRAVLDDAAADGAAAADPLDAVEAAVRRLETAPRFNAGIGSAIQSDGVARTDAGIMRGDREVGAVCSLPGVEHAVSAARVVATKTPHVLVCGERGVALADAAGIETGGSLLTDRTRERWAALDPPADATEAAGFGEGRAAGSREATREQLAWVRERFGEGHDTVGAVAFDDRRPSDGGDAGRVAAATSTGGRWCALAGRVGDVPQVGGGFYATPAGAASATGAGEAIATDALSRRAVGYLEAGATADAAARRAIETFADHTGATAGVIVLDSDGVTGSAFNSEAMATAGADG